jgi:S-DNA-T family DNA segregation ATPase FtsK/SpoIIIE
MIAGLAARYPPDELAFLLVDYKGGAAFGDCARLPHAAGLVTDLDAALTRRALQSLDAELTRREKLFADVGAADLSAYRARSGGAAALGRLVIVVDEFAALADELPEFVRGLVGVAQRGRSLGLHLVLATQRPGSAVSPEIRANANIRIALRVVDPADSMEVLDTADAALVDRRTPGRALLRVAGPPTAFQCAHAGARVRAAADSVRVLPLGPWRTPSGPADEVPGPSELERLVDLLRSVATRTGRARASSPWRDPLPDSLPVDGPLLANTGDDRESTVSPWIIPLGLVDLPDEQRQQTLTVDLGRGPSGSLVATGRSGRSTALATLAIQAARRLGPALLHVHAIDPSGGLAPLAALPHWGTYAGPDDLSCAATLVERLRAELDRRRQLLASWGHASAAESRAAGRAIPQTLLLVDGWESFCAASDERDAGRTSDALLALARTGPSAGLTVFATGDRGALSPRVSAAFGERWIGALADRMDYGMAGVAAHALPDDVPPGRVVRARDNALVQLGYVGADPTRAEQERAVAAIASTGGDDDNDDDGAGAGAASVLPVVRIRSLPSDVSLATLARPAGSIVLGLAGDGAQPVQIPLRPGTAFLIAGPPRSGRSTALLCMLAQLAPQGAQVVIAASARSPLAAAAVRAGLEVLGPDDALPALAGLAIERGADDPWAPVILLLDDLDRFEGARLADDVAHLLRTRPEDLAVVVTARTDEVATSYRGLAAALRRNRCGLLLQPGPVDGDVLGVQLPRHRAAAPPGRGVLVGDPAWGAAFITSAWIPVQVARP